MGDGGVVCLGDWAIVTISNRATRDFVSNLVKWTSEFPWTYRRVLLRGVGGLIMIGEDLVPGGVGMALSYPPVQGNEKGNGLALCSPLW